MKNLKNRIFIVFVFSFFIISCNKEKDEDNKFSINFENYKLFLKNGINSDGPKPPLLYIKFRIENQSNNLNFFMSKSFKKDEEVSSKLYILDTLKNVIIPLYSTFSSYVKSKESISVNCYLDINDHKEYFKLSDEFLSKRDYTSEEDFLNQLFFKMINNSIIIYDQNINDLKRINEAYPIKTNELGDNFLIKIIKPKKITLKNYDTEINKKIEIIE